MELTQQDIEKISKVVPGIFSVYKIVGLNFVTLYHSEKAYTLSGMSKKEYLKHISDNVMSCILPEDRDNVYSSMLKVIQQEKEDDFLYRIYNKNQATWIHAKAKYIGKIDNYPVVIVIFLSTSLETTGQLSLINNTTNIIYVIDELTKEILFLNDYTKKTFSTESFYGKKCYEYMENLREPCSWCKVLSSQEDEDKLKDFYIPSRDKWYNINWKRITWYGKKSIAVFLTDITYSKKTQLTLEESNESLKSTINNIPVGIAVYRKEKGKITCIAVNPSLAKIKSIVHSKPGKQLDKNFLTSSFTEENEKLRENFFRIFTNGNNVFDYRTINGHSTLSDGTIIPSYIWLHLEGYAADQSDGSQIAYVCLTNITQEKEAVEEANRLRKVEEEQYTHTIDGILAALPKTISTIHLDLTQNYYANYHLTVKDSRTPLESGSIDYLVNFLAENIYYEKSKNEFLQKFNRQSLLDSYKLGQNFLTFDYQHQYSEKSILWETISISIARNPKNGDLDAVLSIVNSEDRITQEQINKHIAFEDYDNIGTISVLDGSVKFFSKNTQELTPHPHNNYDEDIKESLPKILPKEELKFATKDLLLKNIVSALEKKEYFIYCFTVISTNGKRLKKQLRYSYLDEKKQKILFVRTDITESTEQETKRKNELEKALAEAEHANEMKSVFLSSVSHDMRTPLNGIMGYTNLAQQENDINKIKEYLNKIHTSSKSLFLLMNDTLDLTRIENGKEILHPEVIDVEKFFYDIITTVKPSMDSKKIYFTNKMINTKNIYLKFDRLSMEKILLNLLSNASKYTQRNGTVNLVVECTEIEKNISHLKIIIQDNGCGMSKDFIPKAFEPFTQERTEATAKIGGSGLGLSIVKKLVELMGGHIDVESVQQEGTSFYVYLDLEIISPSIQKKSIASHTKDEISLYEKRILLCEDNNVNREIATALLENQGIVITQAKNGKEAFEIYKENPAGTFDVILMDIRMPVMNGYDATELIRNSNKSDSDIIPIIAMTADAYEEDIRHALSVRMNSHISKPIDPNKLFETLRNFC